MGEPVTTGELLLAFVGTVVTALAGAGGFWAWLEKRSTRKSATTQLLLGLAHDRIIHLGMSYTARGSITKDEYEDLLKYMWIPYSVFGGNGLAEKVMADVKLLPMTGANRSRLVAVKEHDDEFNATYGV
jgi:hypothetical protein